MVVNRVIVKGIALFVVVIVLLYPVAVASNLDFIWGSLPSNVRIIGVESLSEADTLEAGEWFQIVYEIKVTKNCLESEDVVRDRVEQHFENFLGRTIREHPELRIYYAEYICYGTGGNIFTQEYYYRVKIIGKVEPLELANGTSNKTGLVSWVAVAIIIGLVVAAIIATIVLIQQPTVQRLLTATSELMHQVAQNPFQATAWTLVAVILSISFLMIIVLVALRR